MNNTAKDIAEVCGIEFIIPQGIRLLKDPALIYMMGCPFSTEDETIEVDIFVEEYPESAEEYIRGQIDNCTIIKDVTDIETNGLCGYAVMYKDRRHEYYIAHYASRQGYDKTHFAIHIECEVSKGSICDALNRREIKELLGSIKPAQAPQAR